MKQVIVEYGSVILDIDGDTLTGVMVNRGGETSDLFSIVKQGSVVPQIVKSPRTLPLYSVAIDKPKVEKSGLTPFPKNTMELIKPNSAWDYLAGNHPPENWTAIAFIPNDAKQYLTDDDNILSVEGHNTDVSSSDFTLDPYLLAVPRATAP